VPEARRAVIDRIIEGTAVVITEPDERDHHLDASDLPAGARDGSVVLVDTQDDGSVVVVAIDEHETARRHEDARQRLERLRAERSSGRFPRPEDRPS
jgi:hypothetical protein